MYIKTALQREKHLCDDEQELVAWLKFGHSCSRPGSRYDEEVVVRVFGEKLIISLAGVLPVPASQSVNSRGRGRL